MSAGQEHEDLHRALRAGIRDVLAPLQALLQQELGWHPYGVDASLERKGWSVILRAPDGVALHWSGYCADPWGAVGSVAWSLWSWLPTSLDAARRERIRAAVLALQVSP